MAPLLDPVRQLVGALAGLGLLPAVFKPLPGLIDTVAGIVNGLAGPLLAPLGIQLDVVHGSNCTVVMYNATLPSNMSFPAFDQEAASIYRYRQQQSVNLGGWFVHESWMTPSLFTCAMANKTSELDLASGWGSVDGARQVLEKHWDTFVTDDDFAYLASIGINTVRIPIGYWSLGSSFLANTPFSAVSAAYTNSWPRVVRAIQMANTHGLGVLIDMHGGVGSQNGLPSSGVSDGVTGLVGNSTNEDLTIAALVYLTQQLVSVNNVVGIELLNEPMASDGLNAFYDKALTAVRATSPQAASFPFYIQDSYQLPKTVSYVSGRKDWIVVDDHSYFVPTNTSNTTTATNSTSASRKAKRAPASGSSPFGSSLQNASDTLGRNVVVGEWSCALSNATLGGMDDPVVGMQDFCRDQVNGYANMTSGWSFWNYNMENCTKDGWCFKALVGNALPSSFCSYPTSNSSKPAAGTAALVSSLAGITLPTPEMMLANAPTADASDDDADETDDSDDAASMLERRHHGHRHHRHHGRVHARSFPNIERGAFLQSRSLQKPRPSKRADTTATTKGYSDGFNTAKTFAQRNMSRLGFVGQYVGDSFAVLMSQGTLSAADRSTYLSQFKRGLEDGEAAVMQAAAPASGVSRFVATLDNSTVVSNSTGAAMFMANNDEGADSGMNPTMPTNSSSDAGSTTSNTPNADKAAVEPTYAPEGNNREESTYASESSYDASDSVNQGPTSFSGMGESASPVPYASTNEALASTDDSDSPDDSTAVPEASTNMAAVMAPSSSSVPSDASATSTPSASGATTMASPSGSGGASSSLPAASSAAGDTLVASQSATPSAAGATAVASSAVSSSGMGVPMGTMRRVVRRRS